MSKSRRGRRTALVLAAVTAAIAAVAICGWLLVSTDTGARLAMRFLRGQLPEGMTIGEVHGPLRGPLTLLDVRYRTDGVSASIDTTMVEWRFFALLRRRVDLVDLQFAGVAVSMTATDSSQSGPDSLPDFKSSFRLHLERAVARRVTVTLPGADSSYRADSILIGATTFDDRLEVAEIEMSAPSAHGTLALLLDPSGTYPMDASFTWSASLRGYTLAGTGSARGDLDSMELTHHLTAPADVRIEATVRDLLGDLTFGASLSAAEFATGDIDSALAPALVSGRFTATGAPDLFATGGTLQVTEPRIGRIETLLRATVEDTVVRIDTVRVRFPGRPGQINVGGVVRRGTDEVEGEVGITWRQINWPFTGPARLSSRGRGQLQFTGLDIAFDLVTTLAGAGVPTGAIRVRGDGNRQRLGFVASGEALGGSVDADATISWEPEVTWRAGITARGLDLSPFSEDPSLALRGVALRARTAGRMVADSFSVTVTLDSARADVRGIPVFAAGTGRLGPSAFALDTGAVRLLEGAIGVSGRVDWTQDVAWNLAFNAHDIEPARLFSVPTDWPGELSTRGSNTGRLTGRGLDLTVRIDTLYGQLRGQQVGARAIFSSGAELVRVSEASLDWGSLRFDASGELGPELSGRIELRAPDLAASFPETGGALTVNLEFSGDRNAPQVSGSMSGDSLRFREMRVGQIRAVADLDFATGGVFGFSFQGTGIVAAERQLDEASAEITGTREAHDFTLRFMGSDLQVELGGSGDLGLDDWHAGLTRLDIGGRAGSWELRSRTPLEATAAAVVLGNLCLDGDGSVCLSGSWERDGLWSGTVDATSLSLRSVAAFVAPDFDITGPVDASGSVRADSSGSLDGSLEILLGPGEFEYRAGAERRRVVFDRSTVTTGIGAAGLQLAWATTLRALAGDTTPTHVDGTLALPDYRRLTDSLPPQRVSGQATAAVDDFSALEAVFPDIVDPAGALRLEISLDGTVAAPRLIGNGRLTGLRADIPLLGLELRDGSLEVAGNDDGVTLAGQIRSGSGVLNVTGGSSGQLAADTVLSLRLAGTNLQAAATGEIQMRASPDLMVNVGGSRIAIDGEVIIPWAMIELREIPVAAVPVSPDVVYVSDTTAAAADELNLRTRVRIVLGDSVSFRGFGFSVRPTGSILVADEPGQVTTGTGQLNLDGGRYRAYGQDLTIERGRVVYAGGPIDNPGLDVRAVRRARDSTVAGLLIAGTLRAPEVTIFSEPPMLQSDALAYLLIGRPLGEASASEGSRLAGAARSLGIRGGNLLAQRIGTRFGLDEFRIEAEDSWQSASFLAGKYLSPRLYVAYSLGLFDSSGLLRVRYLLSSKWTLQAETGDETATDVFYRIERGR